MSIAASPTKPGANAPAVDIRAWRHAAALGLGAPENVAQIASSITNLGLMMQAHSEGPGYKTAMLRPLATELKVSLYTTLRDAAQASFTMVGYDAKKDNTNGLIDNAFNSARATYAGVMTTADVVSSAAMGVLVPGRGDAISIRRCLAHDGSGRWRERRHQHVGGGDGLVPTHAFRTEPERGPSVAEA